MEQLAQASVFETLNAVNVGEHIEKKGNLFYLSWVWAWSEVKKRYPDATYTVYENSTGLNYHTDGKTAWVKTGVTIGGIEHIEYLPVMNNMNKSISLDQITSMDVNKAIQRSITKACARHGLGLYVYAGEDLPEVEANNPRVRMIAELINLAQRTGNKDIIDAINENGLRGQPWDDVPDIKLREVMTFLSKGGKK